jgi:hypothetical protein
MGEFSDYYQESLQWCQRVDLEPGEYIILYEMATYITYESKYLFRLFANSSQMSINNKNVEIEIFNDEKMAKQVPSRNFHLLIDDEEES